MQSEIQDLKAHIEVLQNTLAATQVTYLIGIDTQVPSPVTRVLTISTFGSLAQARKFTKVTPTINMQ